MRVLILGGYGVFGGRLGRLLLKDGHDVIIAGRRLAMAKAYCDQYGGSPLAVDITGDLDRLFTHEPDVVVDAAGPFQFYRNQDPYRLAQTCVDHGVHYLDLSDDGDFTAGIAGLNSHAQTAGVTVLSGVSSVPALSAAAVHALSADMNQIESINTAILPGNRAPRGRSVMRAILSQTGNPMQIWQEGRWTQEPAWCNSQWISIGPDIRRRGSLIGVPDLKLFPEYFAAKTVTFRAGLELPILHLGLLVACRLRAVGMLPRLELYTGPARFIAGLLEPFGTDRGGMLVKVSGRGADGPITRRWELIAEAGHGPFVPATPARALINNFEKLTPGARPCLNELSLAVYEEAMADLRITCEITDQN